MADRPPCAATFSRTGLATPRTAGARRCRGVPVWVANLARAPLHQAGLGGRVRRRGAVCRPVTRFLAGAGTSWNLDRALGTPIHPVSGSVSKAAPLTHEALHLHLGVWPVPLRGGVPR